MSQESTGSILGFRGEAAPHGPRGKRGTGECVFFLVHPLHRRSWRPFGDWDGPSSCVSPRMLLENFLSFALALFALEIWCFISIILVSGSQCSSVWVLLMSAKIGIFDKCLFFVGAILGSTVDTCSASVLLVALDVFHTFSTLRRTRILKCFFSLLLQNGEACPVDASGCSLALRSSHLENLEVLIRSFTWLRCVMRDSIFWPAHMPISS